MPGAEVVVFGLGPVQEARRTPGLPQPLEEVAPTRHQLVRVSLVSDVKDQGVVRAVKHPMKRNAQLDRAKRCAEVTAVAGADLDDLVSNSLRQIIESVGGERLDVLG